MIEETSAGTAASLESVLITEQLTLRPSRHPDYETESRALAALAQHMADSPRIILQKLAEVALDVFTAGSAGVSLVSEETGDFYWPAIAGAWKPHIGGGTPRGFGPCGVVLDTNAVQLFTRPERYYPYLVPASPQIEEALLTPFYANGTAMGTVWVVSHDPSRKFDVEDSRLIQSLGRFAAAAYPLCAALDLQERQSLSLRDINEGLLLSSLRQHELTEQAQKSEAAQNATEERLRLAGTAAKVGTWRLDLHTSLDSRDANLNRLLGLESADSTQPIDDFLRRLHPEDRASVEEEMAKAVRERGPYKVECRVVLPDGTVRWLLNQGHVLLHEGEPRYITGAAVDITLQKVIEKNLRMANEDLEQFGYSASHDLQAPIRNIAVYGELLDRRYGHLLDEQGKSILAVIIGGAKRMQLLLRDLRSYAEAERSENSIGGEISADIVLESALSDLSSEIGGSLAVVSHGELPFVRISAVQLGQVFQNLVGNAIKYRHDSQPPRIHVSVNLQGDNWVFSVRDNGIGIASEHQTKIFGVFKRLHGDSKYAGTGIGLAICKKIVERNGGRIWVESEGNNKGSTFSFTVPVAESMRP